MPEVSRYHRVLAALHCLLALMIPRAMSGGILLLALMLIWGRFVPSPQQPPRA